MPSALLRLRFSDALAPPTTKSLVILNWLPNKLPEPPMIALFGNLFGPFSGGLADTSLDPKPTFAIPPPAE